MALKLADGYAYELIGPKRQWFRARADRWDTVMQSPSGEESFIGQRQIDGSTVAVFKCKDGAIRAQLSHMVKRVNEEGVER